MRGFGNPLMSIATAFALYFIWTTIVSLAVFGLVALVYVNRWVTLDDIAAWLHLPR